MKQLEVHRWKQNHKTGWFCIVSITTWKVSRGKIKRFTKEKISEYDKKKIQDQSNKSLLICNDSLKESIMSGAASWWKLIVLWMSSLINQRLIITCTKLWHLMHNIWSFFIMIIFLSLVKLLLLYRVCYCKFLSEITHNNTTKSIVN